MSKEKDLATNESRNGKISFANDVVAIIAGLATVDVEGIAGMSGGVVEGFTELLGRKNLSKGVKVEVGEEEVAIDVYVVVDYGCIINEVAKEVQSAIKNAIETMTGLAVVEVNVYIQGVHIDKDDKEPEPPRVK